MELKTGHSPGQVIACRKTEIRIRFILSILIHLIFSFRIFGQSTTGTYPKTLFSPDDTFRVRFSTIAGAIPFRISSKDTTDMGTDGTMGLYVTIYYGKDSQKFIYQNMPYGQNHLIHFESPKGKTVYILHFNPVKADFPIEYILKYNYATQVEIPEVYELANIIWLLSPSGQRAGNLNKQGEYYERVISYFHQYLDHPVFKNLDFPPDDLKDYYDFRENSFCYSFDHSKLVYVGPYYYVQGNDWATFNSLFKKLLPLIQDFADKSNFKSFYRSNLEFYAKEILREQEKMPVRKMWYWLEEKFPDIKYNSYKIVFSPLIRGSHSTQNFGTAYEGKWFQETVMFVAGPSIFDNDKELTEDQKTGMLSGIVFTEIDHNYVNPVSEKYKASIDSIFSRRDIWTSSGGDTKFYETPLSVFNEYMTHAVFCLYVLDNFDPATADFILKKREALMVGGRHYIKFKEFNNVLIDLYEQNKNLSLPAIFPQILRWCRMQTQ